MPTKREEILTQLSEARDQYLSGLPERLAEITNAWSALCERWDAAVLQSLHRHVHSLTGSGASFGLSTLSVEARAVEQALKSWVQDAGVPDEQQRAAIAAGIAGMRAAAEKTPQPMPAMQAPGSLPGETSPEHLVYLLEDDHGLAILLADQLSQFNYRAETFPGLEQLETALSARLPEALIADRTLPDGAMAGGTGLGVLLAKYPGRIPLIVISARNDFEARLAAVQDGADAYFIQPLDITSLIERLDALTRRVMTEPYRVLVVDDDENLARHYGLVLRGGGMQVQVLNRPEAILSALVESSPELILMDVYMPACTGLELARLIRQQDAYLGIPIVFLSSETDFDRQFLALRQGGDDFLTKPISDDRLLASVLVRAERARQLNTLMSQDSLTGLLTHVKIKEQLEKELLLAQRIQKPLSVVMLDIDFFKRVNDQYGHMTGDRVIVSLARLLKERLRSTDSIGRYGGEEFLVILPSCSAEEALKLTEECRECFVSLSHRHGGHAFSQTFSAGVACSANHGQADELIHAADTALYGAKQAGRNRSVIAR